MKKGLKFKIGQKVEWTEAGNDRFTPDMTLTGEIVDYEPEDKAYVVKLSCSGELEAIGAGELKRVK